MTSIFTSQSINYPDGLPSVGIVPSRSFASCVIICFFSFFACIYFFKIKYSIFKDRRNFCFTCSLISRQNCYTTSCFLQSKQIQLIWTRTSSLFFTSEQLWWFPSRQALHLVNNSYRPKVLSQGQKQSADDT